MARSFVWDGTEWIKEDEILPPSTEASNISYDNTESGLDAVTVQDAIDELASGKVDAEAGKGLSSNDFTTEEKNKLNILTSLPQGTNNGDILMWDASQNKYISKPKWQIRYQPVEYVQNQFYETSREWHSSYINTGIIPQIGDVWTLEFSLTTSSRSNISGVTVFTLEPDRMYGLVIREEKMFFYNLNQTWIEVGNADTNKHTIVGNTATGKIYFDGTEIDAPSEANSEHPLYLFCCNNGVGVREDLANVKIYYTKYERNGAKLFEYYPAYSLIDGKIGMFETVTNTFVESADKSYPFLKGADV